MKKRLFIILLALCLAALFGCSSSLDASPDSSDSASPKPGESGKGGASAAPSAVNTGALKVHFIYVGQGDSAFIEFPDGETMLIDAGAAEQGANVINYISGLGYNKIDYVVGTHPHTDHIGGLLEVLRTFKVGNIYMPDASSDIQTYADLMQLIKDNGIPLTVAQKDVVIKPGFAAILSPVTINTNRKEMNDNSAVVRVTYGNTNFLFTGDASKNIEQQLLTGEISADVLKVGNHGSSYASSPDFIAKVSPKIAVITCGKNNQYNLPNPATLKTLQDAGATIYDTSRDGTVTITSDGTNVSADKGTVADVESELD